jgi:hypothetical protein
MCAAPESCRFAELITASKKEDLLWLRQDAMLHMSLLKVPLLVDLLYRRADAKGQFEYALADAVRVRDGAHAAALMAQTFPEWNGERFQTQAGALIPAKIRKTYRMGREPRIRISTSLFALCCQSGLEATLETPMRARSRSNGSRSLRISPLLIARFTSALIAPWT